MNTFPYSLLIFLFITFTQGILIPISRCHHWTKIGSITSVLDYYNNEKEVVLPHGPQNTLSLGEKLLDDKLPMTFKGPYDSLATDSSRTEEIGGSLTVFSLNISYDHFPFSHESTLFDGTEIPVPQIDTRIYWNLNSTELNVGWYMGSTVCCQSHQYLNNQYQCRPFTATPIITGFLYDKATRNLTILFDYSHVPWTIHIYSRLRDAQETEASIKLYDDTRHTYHSEVSTQHMSWLQGKKSLGNNQFLYSWSYSFIVHEKYVSISELVVCLFINNSPVCNNFSLL